LSPLLHLLAQPGHQLAVLTTRIALDHGLVQADGRDALVRTAPPDRFDQTAIDLRQSTQRFAFLGDKAHPAHRQFGLRAGFGLRGRLLGPQHAIQHPMGENRILLPWPSLPSLGFTLIYLRTDHGRSRHQDSPHLFHKNAV
jgi:hypothetical protein